MRQVAGNLGLGVSGGGEIRGSARHGSEVLGGGVDGVRAEDEEHEEEKFAPGEGVLRRFFLLS